MVQACLGLPLAILADERAHEIAALAKPPSTTRWWT